MTVYDIATKLNIYLEKGIFNGEIAKIVVKTIQDKEVKETINIGAQHYIEDNIFFLFKTPLYSEETINVADLYDVFENESKDKCWQPTNLLDRNHLLNCEVQFYNVDCDTFLDENIKIDYESLVYDVEYIEFDRENNQFVLYAE